MITKTNNTVACMLRACILCCNLVAALTSCSDMFETDSDRQIFDPELDQKTDSMFYTLGILKGLQQVADQYVMTGEMRGDLVATNGYTETDLRDLASFSLSAPSPAAAVPALSSEVSVQGDLQSTNKYNQPYLYYRIINNCNYYIAHRDTTLLTGSRKVAIPEYAQALAVRAWAYLQLAKTYGEVPFYTEPLVSIGDANRNFPTKDLQGICDALTPELIKFSGTPVPDYGNISAGMLNGTTSAEEKIIRSDKAMIPVDVILGDLFLETNQYEQAAKYYFNYILVNELVAQQAYLRPSAYSQMLAERLPNDITIYINTQHSFTWNSIFATSNPQDIVTYIPLASNELRGITTELPRYFGYDFYSTTTVQGDLQSPYSVQRYLVDRQIDASQAYYQLNQKQQWYYVPTSASQSASTLVKTANIGDLRRYATMRNVSKQDSIFSVMTKFFSANVPIYRTATIYLRLAEAINRMGQPEAAFAILKDGIKDDISNTNYPYFHPSGYDQRMGTLEFLETVVPFLSIENYYHFSGNWGIHSRGAGYTQGAYTPYQLDTLVAQKIAELNITPMGNLNDTINAVEDLICDEMALELAFEGNRFGDLTRIARHKNLAAHYAPNYGSKWLADKLAYKNPKVSLLDEKNWYLPLK